MPCSLEGSEDQGAGQTESARFGERGYGVYAGDTVVQVRRDFGDRAAVTPGDPQTYRSPWLPDMEGVDHLHQVLDGRFRDLPAPGSQVEVVADVVRVSDLFYLQ